MSLFFFVLTAAMVQMKNPLGHCACDSRSCADCYYSRVSKQWSNSDNLGSMDRCPER